MDSLKDPVSLTFGNKFMKLGLRKVDRDYLQLFNDVNSVFLSFIKKSEAEGSKENSKSIIELLLKERKS